MLNWFRHLKSSDKEATELLQQAHKENVATLKRAKVRSEIVGKQADKKVRQVYDVAEKIFIATGQRQ